MFRLAALFNDTQQQAPSRRMKPNVIYLTLASATESATAKDTRGRRDDKSLPPPNRQDPAQILKQRRPTTDGG